MNLVADISKPNAKVSRVALALDRHARAIAALADCHLCAHRCGVNRLTGELGLCHAGAETRLFSAQVEVTDEVELIPTFAVALSGCDLRCSFCITGATSWNPRAGETLDPLRLAAQARDALTNGARSIMILGGEPTIHLPAVLRIIATLPEDVKLLWKTNGHATSEARELLDGLFDCWVVDYKFGNDICASRLARVPCYTAVLRENLTWAYHHSDLIVRHLLMPGHGECCWQPVAEWLGEYLPGVKVNLRSGFWPAWQAHKHAELKGTTTDSECRRAKETARAMGLNLVD